MAKAKRKKKFFDVEIPLIGKETQLFAYEIEDLNGRFINYDLTRVLRGKSMEATLKVVVQDGKATTIPKKTKLFPHYLKRMVRKGTNYVEDSFILQSKNSELRIKPFLITRKKVSRAVRKALRNKAKEELIEYAKGKDFEQIFEDITKNKIQKELGAKLKKVYPLSLCEIRVLKVIEKTSDRK